MAAAFLTSQVLFLATALAASAGTVFLFDLLRERCFPPPQIPRNQDSLIQRKQLLKSCLSSGKPLQPQENKKRKRKKKRVQFADDVKDSKSNGNRKKHRKFAETDEKSCCGNAVVGLKKLPANRATLYSGILIRERLRRMGTLC
ncbi:uncharacterized protein LOC105164414 isoform X2 [Sesamum indicum]|uniref:Uncharacterized protein LOC105164414 isoform X2 n=1 Tax=Sesamum indicum TaxID=4182 RepID=A0A8M8UY01_SESIN|nr:uncharacterized protein LOC105164414 isoform X2 [Sesamum indicum]